MKTIKTLDCRALRRGVAALLLVTSVAANAYDFEAVNNDGVTIYYNILSEENKTCEVTSSSALYYSGVVVIPETATYNGTTYSVTSIGDYAFYNCTGLTSVTIPNSVTTIGNQAFYSCTGLTEVTIGESVRKIGSYAFRNCTGLTSVTIPNSVTTIGDDAFEYCSGLTEVTIGEGVETIGEGAFVCCTGLTSVTIPNSVTKIGSNAFWYCSGLTSVTIGNSVTSIGSYAFSDCTGLTSIYSLNPEPPTCGDSYVFYRVDTSTCVLYVPEGSKEAYSTAYVWEDFLNIVDNQPNAIEDIMTNGNAEAEGYYTTDGKQVSTPQRGINIIRYSDGTAKKVLVK